MTRVTSLIHELPMRSALRTPTATALKHRQQSHTYHALHSTLTRFAHALLALNLGKQERVAVFLPKQFETVVSLFGAAAAGGVFVPVNPILKAPQVQHILCDCNVRVLVTSSDRLAGLLEILPHCPDLRHVILTDSAATPALHGVEVHHFQSLLDAGHAAQTHRVIDTHMAAILYTSGSTGKPKGVVLTHRNMVTGAHSVAQYLENTSDDKLLAVLPFSFDYGFSQMSTAFHVGASVVLMDYLFPRDIINMIAKEQVTGLAGVPPLWSQLADLPWSDAAQNSLRYITNSGGAMPAATLAKLRQSLPKTKPFLMYGLTEAFRSTYLPPSEIDRRPGSMGKAIPNAEIMVVRPDGSPCAPHEPGELVHRGSLVALGYWNDPAKTAERYKPVPNQDNGLVLTEMAVWSGDTVKMDEDGYLYFVGRRDEMIKTSGYRVSPSEIEEVIFATGLVADAAAVGVPHPTLGQAIVIVAAAAPDKSVDSAKLLEECKRVLPAYMVPAHIEFRDALPRNPNGKYDRPKLAAEMKDLFTGAKA
jgi:acyl-CoA ligase (AMP-forming) (exosortase A-associated)